MAHTGRSSEKHTVRELFDRAVEIEESAGQIYGDLATRFSADARLSEFWLGFRKDERLHAQELREVREGISAGRLDHPADREQLEAAERTLMLFSSIDLETVRLPEHAFTVARWVENSEMNSLYRALVGEFNDLIEERSATLSALTDHLLKLSAFSQSFGPS